MLRMGSNYRCSLQPTPQLHRNLHEHGLQERAGYYLLPHPHATRLKVCTPSIRAAPLTYLTRSYSSTQAFLLPSADTLSSRPHNASLPPHSFTATLHTWEVGRKVQSRKASSG